MEQSLCECGSLPNSDSISVIPTWCQSMQAGSVTALAEVGTAPDLIMGLGNGVHDHGQLLCGNTLFYFTH